jgi:hypothetical protein
MRPTQTKAANPHLFRILVLPQMPAGGLHLRSPQAPWHSRQDFCEQIPGFVPPGRRRLAAATIATQMQTQTQTCAAGQ